MIKNSCDILNGVIGFLIEKQVGDVELWRKLVAQFKGKTDKIGYYKGEYWGKIMRGATLIQKYTKDDVLYGVLEDTVKDLLSSQEPSGRISAYKVEDEFNGWDVWSRKYVAVGLEYFLDICKQEKLKKQIITSLKKHLDYIIERVGDGNNKVHITDTSNHWGGMNSCSILKAFLVAFRLTNEQKYMDFAQYIINSGAMKGFNIFKTAYDDKLCLRQYKHTKAYEMTSCFEGLLEYYKITKKDWAITACRNFANRIIDEEYTVVGGGACNTECFNNSKLSQTHSRKKPLQETCVTVSYMLYFYELYKVCGDTKYLDCIEKSFYNAYLGAINETAIKKTSGLPIDWYSPLVRSSRANKCTAGRQTFSDGSIYSCCTAIGSAGVGVFADAKTIIENDGVKFNFYANQIIENKDLKITQKTLYPKDGQVSFIFEKPLSSNTKLSFRLPGWCDGFSIKLNGKDLAYTIIDNYITVSQTIKCGDVIAIAFDMRYKYDYLPSADFEGGYLYFSKGAIVYAMDGRYQSVNTSIKFEKSVYENKLVVCKPKDISGVIDGVEITEGKSKITLIDYASSGSTYDNKSKINVFIPVRKKGIANTIKYIKSKRYKKL